MRLKLRKGMGGGEPLTRHSHSSAPSDVFLPACGRLSGSLVAEAPNRDIHNFEATLTVTNSVSLDGDRPPPTDGSNVFAVGPPQLLLRGSIIRNTRFVLGVVVYTGRESKVMMNARDTPSKLSTVEKTVNRCIFLIFITQFLLVSLSVGLGELFNYVLDPASANSWYLGGAASGDYVLPTWLANWFTFLILYTNFIPISLYVTVEICHYMHSMLIQSDIEMYDPASDTAAKVRTSSHCQEIGQIQYVFSDKTGTLTDNIMTFRRCTIQGKLLSPCRCRHCIAFHSIHSIEEKRKEEKRRA